MKREPILNHTPSLLRKRHAYTFAPLLFSALMLFAGCDSSSSILAPEATSAASSSEALAARLNLTPEQQALLETSAAPHDPVAGWEKAKELQQTLSAEQKEALFTVAAEQKEAIKEKRSALRQDTRQRGQRRTRRSQALNRNLTEEQQEALTSYRSTFQDLRKQLREGTLSREEFDAQTQNLRSEMKETLSASMTDEQKNRREAFSANREERAAEREAQKTAIQEIMELSPEQSDALTSQREAFREKIEALREQAGTDREAFREQLKALSKEEKEAREAIFTDEQKELIQIHRALMLSTASERKAGAKSERVRGRRGRLQR